VGEPIATSNNTTAMTTMIAISMSRRYYRARVGSTRAIEAPRARAAPLGQPVVHRTTAGVDAFAQNRCSFEAGSIARRSLAPAIATRAKR
jgi:hypothetical protein